MKTEAHSMTKLLQDSELPKIKLYSKKHVDCISPEF